MVAPKFESNTTCYWVTSSAVLTGLRSLIMAGILSLVTWKLALLETWTALKLSQIENAVIMGYVGYVDSIDHTMIPVGIYSAGS